jgi:hypothetical protein
MKKYLKIGLRLTVVSALVALTSCSEDFIDVTPNTFVSAERVEESVINDPGLVLGQLNGIYTTMIETGTGGTGDHSDIGQKGYDIQMDMLTGDMALSANIYGWYIRLAQFQPTTDYTLDDNYKPWRYYYRIIRACNFLISTSGGNDAVPEDEQTRFLVGQTKAMRAYAYFYLSQLYTTEGYAPDELTLPLYIEVGTTPFPKSTGAEIYTQIVNDLTDAITLMDGFVRSSKNQVDVNIAKGLLAYTYAAMGNNAEVANLTNEVINSGEYTVMSQSDVLGGFNDQSNSGWMWAQDIVEANGLGLLSWWGQMDIFSYSYAWAGDRKTIDQNLFDAIPADDVRKGQFLDNPASGFNLTPYNKFYAPERTIGGATRTITVDYVFMRVAEMYLLNAEANAKLGNTSAAQASLKAIVSNRVPDATYVDGLTDSGLLREIDLQARIELWGEGKSYLSMKRNKRSMVRGSNHLSDVGAVIPSNDTRLTFEIPQAEILNNPNIDLD